jgi:hypothetical protein
MRQALEAIRRFRARRRERRDVKRVAKAFGMSERAARQLAAAAELSEKPLPDGTIIDA